MDGETVAGAARTGGEGAATPGWAGAVDPALVSRLQRPARQPGLVRLGHARALLARHRAMAPGVPLAEAMLRRFPEGQAGADAPVVVARAVAEPDDVPVEPPRADAHVPVVRVAPVPARVPADPPVPGPAPAGPVASDPAGSVLAVPGHATPGSTTTARRAVRAGAARSGAARAGTEVAQAVRGSASPLAPGRPAVDPSADDSRATRVVRRPAEPGDRPATAVRPNSGSTAVRPNSGSAVEPRAVAEVAITFPPATTGSPAPELAAHPPAVPPPVARPLPAPPPVAPPPAGSLQVPAPDVPRPVVRTSVVRTDVPRAPRPDGTAGRTADLPTPARDPHSVPSPVVGGRPRSRLSPVPPGPAGEPGAALPVVRPTGPSGTTPVDITPSGAAPVATHPTGSARPPVVRPERAAPQPEEVHRLVVRELARTAASSAPAPALPLPVPVAAPAARTTPVPAGRRPEAPVVRADRPVERPRRIPAPVDVGQIADAVSRRIARGGVGAAERRGMGR